jgi:hypothetical protein
MKRLDLNGNESMSIRPVDVGTGTREENVAPDTSGISRRGRKAIWWVYDAFVHNAIRKKGSDDSQEP